MKEPRGFRFNPGLAPWAAVLLIAPSFAWLGMWQLHRADEKLKLQQAHARGAAELMELLAPLPAQLPRFQHVRARGRYDMQHQFVLENMVRGGTAGAEILSVFELPGTTQRLLVNRGWIEIAADRGIRPSAPLPAGDLIISGRMDWLPRAGIRLGTASVENSAVWPRSVVFPTMTELAAELPFELYPMVLLLDSDVEGGFERSWRPAGTGRERHLAYAVQWFALALAVVVIFVIVNLKRANEYE